MHAQQAREAAAVMPVSYFSAQRLDILVPVKLDILRSRHAKQLRVLTPPAPRQHLYFCTRTATSKASKLRRGSPGYDVG